MDVLLADIVWPALFLADRMVATPVIAAGLLVEAVIFHRLYQVTWRRAFGAAITINLISALVGIALLPVWGWFWELAVMTRNDNSGWGTFNRQTWAETCLMAWMMTTVVEALPLRLIVGRRSNLMAVLLMANAISVGIAYVSLSFLPPRHDPWPVHDWMVPGSPYIS